MENWEDSEKVKGSGRDLFYRLSIKYEKNYCKYDLDSNLVLPEYERKLLITTHDNRFKRESKSEFWWTEFPVRKSNYEQKQVNKPT